MELITYLLKVFVCSGILLLYYRIFLFNRRGHHFNRIFLLATTIFSMLVPLITIGINSNSYQPAGGVIRLLDIVETSGTENTFVSAESRNLPLITYIITGYILISVLILINMLMGIARLFISVRRLPQKTFDGIRVFYTTHKPAPFSFLNTIFWHSDIDMESEEGRQILQHELAHIRGRHSYDKLLMNLCLIVCWINPFFWLIRRELATVHEFIADKASAPDGGLNNFASVILAASFPGHRSALTNNFNSSSIKRRMHMLKSKGSSRFSFLAMLLTIPVAAILFLAFTIKSSPAVISDAKPFVLVIDAGHGGGDNGASAADGSFEKDINLKLAQAVLKANRNENLKVILIRDNDVTLSPRERVQAVVAHKPDAFISLHVNNLPDASASGFEMFITKNAGDYMNMSRLLGSVVAQRLSKIYRIAGELAQRTQGVWVLDAPEVQYPALLIHCGNLRNEDDMRFINDPGNQEKIAAEILAAVSQFAQSKRDFTVSEEESKKIIVENNSSMVKVVFSKNNNNDQLRLVKEELKKQGVDLNFSDVQFDASGELSALKFSVDFGDGFSGAASTARFDKVNAIGFYRNYSAGSKSSFGTGGFFID